MPLPFVIPSEEESRPSRLLLGLYKGKRFYGDEILHFIQNDKVELALKDEH